MSTFPQVFDGPVSVGASISIFLCVVLYICLPPSARSYTVLLSPLGVTQRCKVSLRPSTCLGTILLQIRLRVPPSEN